MSVRLLHGQDDIIDDSLCGKRAMGNLCWHGRTLMSGISWYCRVYTWKCQPSRHASNWPAIILDHRW